MRRGLALVLTAALLSACVAITVDRRKPRKGPVKEVGYVDFGGGEVRYSLEGWGPFVASRRRLALRLMSRNCGRDLKPKITDEFERQDADAKYSEEDVTSTIERGDEHYVIERFQHIAYDCRPTGWVEPVYSTGAARPPFILVPISTETAAIPVSTETAVVPVSTAAPSVPVSTSAIPAVPEPPR